MPENRTFTFKGGLTVTLQPVNRMWVGKVAAGARRRHVEEHGEPEAPTYEVPTAGGVPEVNTHTEESVKLEPWRDDQETQDAWNEYATKRLRLDVAVAEASLRARAIQGIVEEPPEGWRDDCAYWGIDLPDDPRDAKFEWLFENSTGWDEMMLLGLAVQALNDPVEEAARAAEDTFRRSMESSDEGPDAGADQGEAGEA